MLKICNHCYYPIFLCNSYMGLPAPNRKYYHKKCYITYLSKLTKSSKSASL